MYYAKGIDNVEYFIINEVSEEKPSDGVVFELAEEVYLAIKDVLKEYKVQYFRRDKTITDISELSLLYEEDKQYFPVSYYEDENYNIITGHIEYKGYESKRFSLDKFLFISQELYTLFQSNTDKMSMGKYVVKKHEYLIDKEDVIVNDDATALAIQSNVITNISKEDEITNYKNISIREINKKIKNSINNSFFIDFIQFTIQNNILLSKGYTITEENKENMYNRILESDDSETLNALSLYIDSYNKIENSIELYKEYKNVMKEIKELNNIIEIDKKLNEFKNKYNI